jgi:hypothetical protein
MGDLQSFHRLLPPPTPDVIKYLRNQGVTIDTLCEPELPAFVEVVFHDNQPFFDFTADVGDDGAVQRSSSWLATNWAFLLTSSRGRPGRTS